MLEDILKALGTGRSAVLETVAGRLREKVDERLRLFGQEVVKTFFDLAAKDARDSLKGMSTFFKVHSLKWEANSTELHSLEMYYTALWFSGDFIPGAKWACASFLASHSGVDGKYRELPPLPAFLPPATTPSSFLFPSLPRLQKVLRTRLSETQSNGAPTTRALKLSWSLLGLKDLMPPMWVTEVLQSLKDHASLLSSQPPLMEEDTADILQLVSECIGRAVVSSVDGRAQILPYSRLPTAKLSASSGWVKYYSEETKRWRKLEGTRAAQFHRLGGLHAEEFLGMSYDPHQGTTEYRGIPYQFDWKDWDFDPNVSIVALQEPFKIRTISVADGPAAAAGSPIQKVLFRVMKDLGPFRLIGGEDLREAVAKQFAYRIHNFPWVSGDYSAATDRLSMIATEIVFDGCTKYLALPLELKRRLKVSLTSSILDYQRTLDQFKDQIPQTVFQYLTSLLPPLTPQRNGQLMGNILSFPILCIINLCGFLVSHYRAFINEYDPSFPNQKPIEPGFGLGNDPEWDYLSIGSRVHDWLEKGEVTISELSNLPVLVNGDDILFQADTQLYGIWLKVIGELGFKTSVGKNYISKHFFTINSQMFSAFGLQKIDRPWWGGFEMDFFRLRRNALSSGNDVLTADPRMVLVRAQEKLRDSVPLARWPQVNQLWMDAMQKADVLGPLSGLNWFLPIGLGGVGLDPSGFQGWSVTYAQQKLANRLLLDPEAGSKLMPRMDSSLVSEAARLAFRSSAPTWYIPGEVVERDGVKMVMDRNDPVALRRRGDRYRTYYVGYPLVSSLESSSQYISTWLDYHLDGARFDVEKARRSVSRMLRWGLRLSDKKVRPVEELDPRPRFRCFKKRMHIPV
jgi:hypothetical protein